MFLTVVSHSIIYIYQNVVLHVVFIWQNNCHSVTMIENYYQKAVIQKLKTSKLPFVFWYILSSKYFLLTYINLIPCFSAGRKV